MTNFDKAFEFTVGIEGGFSDNPNDRGGPTKYGITIETLTKWRKKPCTRADVWALDLSEAKEIYLAWYWNQHRLGEITNTQVAMCIFDQVVNSNAFEVIQLIQRIVGVTADGFIGPKTIAEINNKGSKNFIWTFFKLRQEAYVGYVVKKPSQIDFLLGWIRRTHHLLELSL